MLVTNRISRFSKIDCASHFVEQRVYLNRIENVKREFISSRYFNDLARKKKIKKSKLL